MYVLDYIVYSDRLCTVNSTSLSTGLSASWRLSRDMPLPSLCHLLLDLRISLHSGLAAGGLWWSAESSGGLTLRIQPHLAHQLLIYPRHRHPLPTNYVSPVIAA